MTTRRLSAVVGLGSNVGDRLASLRAAAHALADLGEIAARSRVYESAPVGGPDQGPFLNAAVRLDTPHAPLALLDALLAVERGMGRVRRERWGPRTIDLDILWIEGVAVTDARLSVPHPHLTERAFALRTLWDVAPDARDPRSGAAFEMSEEAARQVLTALDAAL